MFRFCFLFFCITLCNAKLNFHSILSSNLNFLQKIQPFFRKTLPDTAQNPFSYLEQHKYPYENHTIITEDGYILLLVRIPFGKKNSSIRRPPVLFVHGIFCQFYDFLNAGPERAIGFEILEEGYDIWLLNSRGNTFSKDHVTLDHKRNASAYWNFSWHEIGLFDIPAAMDYITHVTGFPNMSIVGHSEGGTVYFVFATLKPEYGKRILVSLQLAPVVYLTYTQEPFVLLLKHNMHLFEKIVKVFNLFQSLPKNGIYSLLGNTICNAKSPILDVCSLIFQVIGGPSNQLNKTLFPVLTTNDVAGAATKEVIHYLQIANSDRFQWYDYGPKRNLLIYKQKIPPLYNLSVITSPVVIFVGKSDTFASIVDTQKLISQIQNVHYFPLDYGTNHLDVMWGTKAVRNVHTPAIKLLNRYNNMANN